MSTWVIDSPAQLSREIEEVRCNMVHLGVHLGLKDPKVQQCSEQLDVLLLKYYQTMTAQPK